MKLFYIFNYIPEFKEGVKPYTATFLFIPSESFVNSNLSEELKVYFQTNSIPDELFVLGAKDVLSELKQFFLDGYPTTFRFINQSSVSRFQENVHVMTFDGKGELELHSSTRNGVLDQAREIIDDGLRKIFVARGGLIQSRYSHHFVFPSGKHSESFLRTGNILIYGPEIYFIASQLLSKFNHEDHKMILCDTSSISSLAYALIDLKRRLVDKFLTPHVNSFKSYSVFEDSELAYGKSALILISSSTSGGIIARLEEKMKAILDENVVLIYFLGKESDFQLIEGCVICNLNKKHSKTGSGHVPFETHSADECKLCNHKKSLAVNVTGDIFLSENPKIDRVVLSTEHAPSELASFAEEFIVKDKGSDHVLKCNYKESGSAYEKHNIFVDMQIVFREIQNVNSNRFTKYKKALYEKIRHHIPAQTKYIVRLDDIASEHLSNLILEELRITQTTLPEVISHQDISAKLNPNVAGSVVVVSSCMLSGRNLLLISKQLREFDKLSIVYFVGLVRARNTKNYKFIRSNLVHGAKGKARNSFVEIENICIPDDSVDTVWQREISFLGELLDFLEDKAANRTDQYKFYQDRKIYLESVNNVNRGLANELFYPTLANNKQQLLNKNFAFLEPEIHDTHCQAEVYFIISIIINHLRQAEPPKVTLIQTEYCRQIINPSNFLRYNDGIIQSSILRAATAQELAYDLDLDSSLQMTQIIENEIELFKKGMDEALHEFIYAIASGNLKLKHNHRKRIFDKIALLNCPVLAALCEFHLEKKASIKRKRMVQNGELLRPSQLG